VLFWPEPVIFKPVHIKQVIFATMLRIAQRVLPSQALSKPSSALFAGKRALTVVCWTDMGRSKHDFVHFIKNATSNNASPEAHELHKYLTKCFIDADSDYDGLVTYQGFNNMITEAALVPRRFGFAPHTREMYASKEAFETDRTALYKALSDSSGKVTLENWIGWAKPHIFAKSQGLEDHRFARWERNLEGFKSFFQGVAKQGSSHNHKTSQSTQLKEFYILTSRQFLECDVHNNGYLGRDEFTDLIRQNDGLVRRFGQDWYSETKFEDIEVEGKITWKSWYIYHLKLVTEKAALL